MSLPYNESHMTCELPIGEDPPAGAVEREQYFMTHIGMGEQLLA